MTETAADEILTSALRLAAGPGDEPSSTTSEAVLVLNGVDKRYGGVHAISDVTLEVIRGEVHGLVGENGAGKSTLVGIAAGTVTPDKGTIEINGVSSPDANPDWARDQGLAIVFQEPALLPDLTVAENMRLGMPRRLRPPATGQNRWARSLLDRWSGVTSIDPQSFVRDLRPDARFVVEIARAIAEEPAVLVLDEPTEHLMADGVSILFEAIAEVVARGGAVIYISHRIHEVKAIAHRVTVLRDGCRMATREASELSEKDIVDLVVGRRLDARFPPKPAPESFGEMALEVENLRNQTLSDVRLHVREGEILGLAGIEGQGQREALRAIAGLTRARLDVKIAGAHASVRTPAAAYASGIAYLSHDRYREGVLSTLSVRENAAAAALGTWSRGGFLFRSQEKVDVQGTFRDLNVKTESLDTPIDALSGGNQQKVMFSRALLTSPKVFLADEPTQGVDIGARTELYGLLRSAAERGTGVIVVSADAAELAGLCDRVVIFSRGRPVTELIGTDITERAITQAAMTSTTAHGEESRPQRVERKVRTLERVAHSDRAPALALVPALIALAWVAADASPFYVTSRNFTLLLPLVGTLALFALGQQLVMITGAIDLSIGPLAGLQVVIASFMLGPGVSGVGMAATVAVMVVVGLAVGLLNWALTELLEINALIATLVTFSALQGVSLILRPTSGGAISRDFTDIVRSRWGIVPGAVIAVAIVAIAFELFLYRTSVGVRVRATGSDGQVARKVGVSTRKFLLMAYCGSALFATLAAFMLMAQSNTGNATIGNSYTLSSVAAVVLGGASIFGGRGSFVGAVLGAATIIQINTVVQFVGWSLEWQQYLLGGLTLCAASLYSTVRGQRG